MNREQKNSPSKAEAAPPLSKRLYDEAAAAAYLGRTLWSMRELRYSGKIAFVQNGKRKFYDIQDLDAWIERNKTRNTF